MALMTINNVAPNTTTYVGVSTMTAAAIGADTTFAWNLPNGYYHITIFLSVVALDSVATPPALVIKPFLNTDQTIVPTAGNEWSVYLATSGVGSKTALISAVNFNTYILVGAHHNTVPDYSVQCPFGFQIAYTHGTATTGTSITITVCATSLR